MRVTETNSILRSGEEEPSKIDKLVTNIANNNKKK